MEYQRDNHPNSFTDKFEQFRRDGKFCDFELTCGGPALKVHHLVMAAASPVFEETLNAGCKDFRLDFVESDVLTHLVDFMYTGKVSVPSTRVQALMCAANFLELDDLVRVCADHLTSHVQSSNALSIFRSAEECNRMALMEAARRCYCREYLGLPLEPFLELLSLSITTRQANELERMCLRWLQHEPVRIQHCTSVLDRLQLADPSWLATQLKDVEEPRLARALADLVLLKNPTLTNLQLHVVGGRLQLPDGSIEITATALKYDLRTRTWSDIAPMSTPRTGHGVAVLKGRIYAIGGQSRIAVEGGVDGEGGDDEIMTLASAEVYDPASDEWSPLPPMREARSHFGLVADMDELYAFGGECDGQLKASVERYDPLSREWEVLGDMPEPRSQMTVVSFNNNAYVVGGVVRTARGGRALSPDLWCYRFPMSVRRARHHRPRGRSRAALERHRRPMGRPELTDGPGTSTRRMRRLAPMRRARCALAGIVEKWRGCLYVLGGIDDDDNLKIVEKYDFATDVWRDVEDLLEPRCGLAAGATFEGLVVVGGGLHWTHGLRADVEFYDLFERRWLIQSPMPAPRVGAGAASVFS